jgi:hypothetical protein
MAGSLFLLAHPALMQSKGRMRNTNACSDWLPCPMQLAAAACLRIINDRLNDIVYIFSQAAYKEKIVDHAQFQVSIPHKLREISSALFALSDILVELSLLLHDLQFEMDQDRRRRAEAEFRAAFEKMRSSRDPDEFIEPL